jgi:hypothetical protein
MKADMTVPVFNVSESIERIHLFEQRGTEFKVRCGLELIRAKLNLNHGAWQPFLFKANIYHSTATRRMKIASSFMEWAGLLPPGSRPTDEGVLKAMNLIDGKSCNMHDFTIIQKIDANTFWSDLPDHSKDWMRPPKVLPHVKLYPAWKQINTFINEKYKKLPTDEREVFKEWLKMQLGIASSLYKHLEEVDQEVPAKRTHRKKIAGEDKVAVQKITEHSPGQAV